MNHRLDLSDGILIKNNHISLGGGMEVVLARAHANRKPEQKIEVEVRSMRELETGDCRWSGFAAGGQHDAR